MAQNKVITKSRKATTAPRKAANGKNNSQAIVSKPRRNGSQMSANELTLIAWQHIYAKRERFGKFD